MEELSREKMNSQNFEGYKGPCPSPADGFDRLPPAPFPQIPKDKIAFHGEARDGVKWSMSMSGMKNEVKDLFFKKKLIFSFRACRMMFSLCS